jgi:hypothetical protein
MMDEGKDCARRRMKPAVVCVMRDHGEKNLTAENTEATEEEEAN